MILESSPPHSRIILPLILLQFIFLLLSVTGIVSTDHVLILAYALIGVVIHVPCHRYSNYLFSDVIVC